MPVDRSDSGIRVMRFAGARRAGADARDTRLPEATRRRRAVPRPDGLPRTVLSAGQLRRLPPSRRAPLVAGMTGRPRRHSEPDRRSTSGASRVAGTQPPTGPGHPWWERAAGRSSALDDAADDTLRRPRTPLRTAVRTDEQPGREAAVREHPDHEHPPSWLDGLTSSLRTAGRDRRTPVGERTADSRHRRRRRPARTLGPAAAAAVIVVAGAGIAAWALGTPGTASTPPNPPTIELPVAPDFPVRDAGTVTGVGGVGREDGVDGSGHAATGAKGATAVPATAVPATAVPATAVPADAGVDDRSSEGAATTRAQPSPTLRDLSVPRSPSATTSASISTPEVGGPAVVSSLGAGDPGFGWPSTAFGSLGPVRSAGG
jgi:hypothetical protein